MEISIVIPTKDRGEVFQTTLTSAVAAISDLHAEIIVVNDSKTNTPSIPAHFDSVKLIHNQKAGVASARNAGAKVATGKLLLFLDDDIVISKQSVAHVLQLHQEYSNSCFNLNWEYDPDVEALLKSTSFGRFLKFHRMTSFKGWYNDPTWVDNAIFPSTSVASFHLSIEKSVFEKTGGYNESFPFAGFEDYDFPRRLKKIAVSFFIDTRVTVFHNEIDKLNLHTWLLAQQRRATTRKVGSLQGYPELALTYGRWKTTILELVSKSERLWMTLLGVMPNTVVCDAMYFKILSLVQSGRIYKGYTDRK